MTWPRGVSVLPRELIRAPQHKRERSLGWLSLAWQEHFCVHGPGDVQGDPVKLGDEMAGFVVDCYALEPKGRLLYDSAFLSRPKGADKSGQGARFGMFEALGPCRFAGFAKGGEVYEDPWGLGFEYRYLAGEPMGRPVRVPYVRCMATEEGQTGNVYDAIYFNLTHGPLSHVPGIDPGLTRTFLPGGGEITPSTASSSAKDGGKETFVDFDESHLYKTPELRRMRSTVARNLRKRKKSAGSWYLETTTMYAAGEESAAEETYALAELIREGKAKRSRLLFDHRWGDCEDLADEPALREALVDAYGDAIAWMDLDALVDEIYDPRSATEDSRRYFLNAPSSTIDAWLTEPEWAGCAHPETVVQDHAQIVLGFDGSRSRSRGVTDATALIGCRVSDGHLFELGVWEQPQGPVGKGWKVPVTEVDAAVEQAFDRYQVVGFFADPAKWETYVAKWEASWASKLKVKASASHPVEWWMTGTAKRTVQALEEFHNAVVDKDLSHDGAYTLTRHVLNARRRMSTAGVQIAKEHPDSARKIDACVAAVLAWQARLAAVAQGIGKRQTSMPRRLR